MLLLQGYCQQGNIAGSTAILEHMKAEEFPINEHAYAALITGHARSGDLSSAEQMLDMMREREVEPTIVSYTSLMCAQAEAGDMEAIRRVRAGRVVAVCALCVANCRYLCVNDWDWNLAFQLLYSSISVYMYRIRCSIVLRKKFHSFHSTVRCQ